MTGVPRLARRLRPVAAAMLLAWGAPAQADPVTVASIVSAATQVGTFIAAYGGYALLAYNIYGGIRARKRAKAAARAQRAAHNARLADRNITVLQGLPPWRIVYGECVTGGDVVAIFTSDRVRGGTTKADGLKHLVIVLASHQVEAIGEIYVEGVPLGTLDANGYPTSTDWAVASGSNAPVPEVKLGTAVFDEAATWTAEPGVVITGVVSATSTGGDGINYQWTIDRTVVVGGGGTTLSVTDGLDFGAVTVIYEIQNTGPAGAGSGAAVIRVSKHLGTDSQTVDSYLTSIKPTEWDSTHRLRGIAYLVVSLDLEDPRFQGGPPNITATVKGKRLYDPRLDSTNGGSGSHRRDNPATWQWSDNPALCCRDWITGEYGMAAPQADVDDTFTVAAANACDVSISVTEGGVTTTAATYRCNGVASAEDSREQVLDELADSMAGNAVYGAQWQIMAGAWTVPVMALTDDDLDGAIEIVQAGAGVEELFNGVRGNYIKADTSVATDFEPYQNSTFVAADGEEIWTDVALPFTSSKPHASNIARVMVEQARSSMVISYPGKLHLWPLQVGDRVTVTSAEYGFTAKTFRVTDWQFGLQAPVTLLLQEDAATVYDTVDEVQADPTPNTDLPSPWVVPAIALDVPESGTDHLVLKADGVITPRVLVGWAALTGAYLDEARVVLRWIRVGPDVDWQQMQVPADQTSAYLTGVADGDRLVIEAWVVNGLGFSGPRDRATHTVVGKTAAPANVSGLTATVQPGGVVITVTPTAELDVRSGGALELRVGASWAAGTRIFRGPADRFVWTWPTAGTYTVRARWIDSSGNTSAADATASVTVGDGVLVAAQQIKPGSVTATDMAEAAGPYSGTADAASVVMTPVVVCDALVTVDLNFECTNSTGSAALIYGAISVGYDDGSGLGGYAERYVSQTLAAGQTIRLPVSVSYRFPSVPAGIAQTWSALYSDHVSSALFGVVSNLRTRVELIYR